MRGTPDDGLLLGYIRHKVRSLSQVRNVRPERAIQAIQADSSAAPEKKVNSYATPLFASASSIRKWSSNFFGLILA